MRVEREPVLGKRGRLLAGIGVATLVVSLLWAAAGPNTPTGGSPYSDTYSRSAIGHEALVAVLQKLGIAVERARFKTTERAQRASLLVVAEPELKGAEDRSRLQDYLTVDVPVLVVLPKWSASQDSDNLDHIDGVWPVEDQQHGDILDIAHVSGRVRTADEARCEGQYVINLELRNVQLISDSDLRPLVSCGDAILVGEHRTSEATRVIVSDPDVMATHGLRHGGAKLMVELIHDLRISNRPVIFDEVLHGHQRIPSVYNEAFSFPMVFLTIQVLLLIGFVLWRTVGRFGAPDPAPRFGSGDRSKLIDNEVRLLTSGADAVASLLHYRDMAFREVRERLGAPRNQDREAMFAWLAEVSHTRGATPAFDAMRKRVGQLRKAASSRIRVRKRDVVATARAITTWKDELLDGS